MPTKLRKVSYPLSYSLLEDNSSGFHGSETQRFSYLVENSFTGDSVPDYVYKIKHGLDATSLASGKKAEMSFTPFFQSVKAGQVNDWQRRITTGYVDTDLLYEVSTSPNGSFDSQIINEALTRFLISAKNKQRQFQSGVFLGELRETIKLIRNPLAGLRSLVNDYVDHARQARRLPVRQVGRHLSNQWLEFTFGALPLISDIENGCELLVRLRNKRYLVKCKGESKGSLPLTCESNVVDLFSGRRRIERRASYHISRRIVGAVYCKSNGTSAELLQGAGATLRDFVPTVYELIPYSFLVDYFSNVGDIINAWSFCQGDLAWYSDTTRRVGECLVLSIPITPKSFFGLPILEYSGVPSSSTYKVKSFTRSHPVSLGLPSLGFRLPGTSTKFLNIAALASLRVL